jgi:hypothetical protein
MIDTAKAKQLRDLAVRLARAEGRSGYNIETNGYLKARDRQRLALRARRCAKSRRRPYESAWSSRDRGA